MTIKNITQLGSRALIGAAAVACASTAHAITYKFTVIDSFIEVGESFDVAFTATFDSALEVAAFAFDVDPFAELIPNGIVAFNDWSVPDPLFEFSFGPPEVGALGDPFDPLYGGTDIQLATLNFTALNVGTQSVSISGFGSSGKGLELYSFDSDSSQRFDIESSFGVEVNAVPDSTLYAALPLLLIGMAAFRRRMESRHE